MGIILAILLVFSVSGFTAYYKYTQESGTNFYVGAGDKADALEDTNEVRQILDDLGNLLGHSKRNDLYPEDGTTRGTLAIPNSVIVSFATGTKGDLFYCSATDVWTKLNIGSDNQILVVSVDVPNWETASSDLLSDVDFIAMLDENEDITGAWTVSTGSIAGVDATEFSYLDGVTSDIQTQFGLRYLKTEVDTQFVKKADTVNVLSDITSPGADIEDAVTKRHTPGSETCIGDVSGTVGANTVDKIKGHTVDETAIGDDKILVYKTTGTKFVYEAKPAAGSTTFLGLTDTPGDYTGKAGEILRVNTTPDAVEFSGITIETTLAVDSDAKVPTSKAVNDFCETTKDYKGKNYYSALDGDNTYSDNADTDTQLVGESVVFGDLLYFDWDDKEWKKTYADAAATMPGLRIALESKIDGEACLMLVKGYIRCDSAFEFTASMVYASCTLGAMSSTAPILTGDQLQRVGVAKSADILFFDPSIDVGEIKP